MNIEAMLSAETRRPTKVNLRLIDHESQRVLMFSGDLLRVDVDAFYVVTGVFRIWVESALLPLASRG